MSTLSGKLHITNVPVLIASPLSPLIPTGYWLYLFNMETEVDRPCYLGGESVKKNEGIVLSSGNWAGRQPFALFVQPDEAIYAVAEQGKFCWITYLMMTSVP